MWLKITCSTRLWLPIMTPSLMSCFSSLPWWWGKIIVWWWWRWRWWCWCQWGQIIVWCWWWWRSRWRWDYGGEMTTIKWRWWRRERAYIELPRRFINRRLRFDPEQNPVQKSSPNDTIQTTHYSIESTYTEGCIFFNTIVKDKYILLRVFNSPTLMICIYLDIYWMCKYKILKDTLQCIDCKICYNEGENNPQKKRTIQWQKI